MDYLASLVLIKLTLVRSVLKMTILTLGQLSLAITFYIINFSDSDLCHHTLFFFQLSLFLVTSRDAMPMQKAHLCKHLHISKSKEALIASF